MQLYWLLLLTATTQLGLSFDQTMQHCTYKVYRKSLVCFALSIDLLSGNDLHLQNHVTVVSEGLVFDTQ